MGVRAEAAFPYLSWSNLDVEVAPLVGDLEYFGPCEAVYPQAVPVDEQAVCTDTQHDVNPLRVLPHSSNTQSQMRLKHNIFFSPFPASPTFA